MLKETLEDLTYLLYEVHGLNPHKGDIIECPFCVEGSSRFYCLYCTSSGIAHLKFYKTFKQLIKRHFTWTDISH